MFRPARHALPDLARCRAGWAVASSVAPVIRTCLVAGALDPIHAGPSCGPGGMERGRADPRGSPTSAGRPADADRRGPVPPAAAWPV
ncbi:hypothetical protein CC117_03985 [Parafrankia colletiae]|uniref:Uncharacterized protein n=1 Tax=Parafrankia colletiae TaxID=573497 RepID=A0A1S1QVZ9_9ACTN|nr:hypothetical protein CC117_03985 [Parafrankia colletiae]